MATAPSHRLVTPPRHTVSSHRLITPSHHTVSSHRHQIRRSPITASCRSHRYDARMAGTRRPWWPIIVAILIVAGFGLYLWAWNDAQSAFADTRVVVDATPLQCSGIEPGSVEQAVDSSSSFSFYRIELRRSMECVIEFHVQNTGERSVDVDRVVIPFGAAGAQGALAARLEPGSLVPHSASNGVDAVFDLDLSLRADERRTFSVTVTFQDGLCFQAGSSSQFDDYVRLDLSRWLFGGQPGNVLVPIAFTGTGDTEGCEASVPDG